MAKTLPRIGLTLLGLLALSSRDLPGQGSGTRTVTGKVVGSRTGEPIGAFVFVVGTSLSAIASNDGSFVLREVPQTSILLRTQLMGYRPGQLQLDAGTDSIDVVLKLIEPPPHSPVSSSFAALDPAEVRQIWTALISGLDAIANGLVSHLQEVERAVPTPSPSAPTGPAHVVLFLQPTSSQALNDPDWLRQLEEARLILGVCRARRASECRQPGFNMFVTPSMPGRFATDSVTVPITYTALDAPECRRGRGGGDGGDESHIIVRQDGHWHYSGKDETAGMSIGGIYCGR